MSSPMPGNPFTDPNWAADLADTVERAVASVRKKSTQPLVKVTRGVVYGLLAAILGIAAIVLAIVMAIRALQELLDLAKISRPVAVYLSYLVVGGILSLLGLFVLGTVPCDVFITEATFALPVFRHPDDRAEIRKLLASVAPVPRAHASRRRLRARQGAARHRADPRGRLRRADLHPRRAAEALRSLSRGRDRPRPTGAGDAGEGAASTISPARS